VRSSFLARVRDCNTRWPRPSARPFPPWRNLLRQAKQGRSLMWAQPMRIDATWDDCSRGGRRPIGPPPKYCGRNCIDGRIVTAIRTSPCIALGSSDRHSVQAPGEPEPQPRPKRYPTKRNSGLKLYLSKGAGVTCRASTSRANPAPVDRHPRPNSKNQNRASRYMSPPHRWHAKHRCRARHLFGRATPYRQPRYASIYPLSVASRSDRQTEG